MGVRLTYWHPGMRLVDGIEALWRMLTYQHIDEDLIVNREALVWVSENRRLIPSVIENSSQLRRELDWMLFLLH